MELQTFEFGAADVRQCHRKGSVLEDHTIPGGPSKIKGISEEMRPFFFFFPPTSGSRDGVKSYFRIDLGQWLSFFIHLFIFLAC